MEVFCEDHRLNISPTYLRPGFAFGGSCLPKDLRALLHLGRMNNVDLPLLAGAIHSNEITISSIVDRVVSAGAFTVALLGLSFKMQTDDLRESPNVALAETLIGKGFNVRIYDPIVNPSRLVGANSAYVEAKLPHLARLLTDTAAEAIGGADVVIVSSSDPAVVDALVAQPAAAADRPQRSARSRRRDAAGLCRLARGEASVGVDRPTAGSARASSSSCRTCPSRSTGACGSSARR